MKEFIENMSRTLKTNESALEAKNKKEYKISLKTALQLQVMKYFLSLI